MSPDHCFCQLSFRKMTRTFSWASCSFLAGLMQFQICCSAKCQIPLIRVQPSVSLTAPATYRAICSIWNHTANLYSLMEGRGEASWSSQNKFNLLASHTIESHVHGSRWLLPFTSVHYLCVGLHIYYLIDWKYHTCEPLSEHAMSLCVITPAKLMEYNVVQ